MRVTTSSITANSLGNLQLALTRYQAAENQASSGKRISKPSDGPADAVQAMSTRSELARLAQYGRNADSGTGFLNTADQALQSTLESLDRARDIVVQASTTGTGSGGAGAQAIEMSSLRSTVLALANSSFEGTPVFAGSAGTSAAYGPDGSYIGDQGSLNRQVGAGQRVAVTVSGTSAFGQPGSDALSVLARISAHLSSGAGVTSDDLSAIDAVRATVTSALATVGTATNRLSGAKSAASDATLNLTSSLSDVEDVDAPAAIIALQTQQVAYQTALAATGKIIQTSLLDFFEVTADPTCETPTMTGVISPGSSEDDGDEPVLHFPAGIVGFPKQQDYLLVRLPEVKEQVSSSVYVLASVTDQNLRFAVADPTAFFPAYSPVLDDETVDALELTTAEDALLLVVLSVGSGKADATANLLAPLVVHRGTRRGVQAVLTGSEWQLREPLAQSAHPQPA